jgi:hypothetical protein
VSWLAAKDPLPEIPRRVLLAAADGARRTSLARRLAAELGSPRIPADSPAPPKPLPGAAAQRFSLGPAWVSEWPDRSADLVRSLLARRADTVVWLDLPGSALRRVVCGARSAGGEAARIAQQVRAIAAVRPELVVVRLRSPREVRRWLRGALRAAPADAALAERGRLPEIGPR